MSTNLLNDLQFWLEFNPFHPMVDQIKKLDKESDQKLICTIKQPKTNHKEVVKSVYKILITFIARICDFVTFFVLINASGNLICKF